MSDTICGKCRLPINPNEPGVRHYGFFVAHEESRCIYLLQQQLAERDAALARCVEAVDVEPELPGDIPDELWYKLKLQIDAGDRFGVAGTFRGVVRVTKKSIHKRVAELIPASAQAAAKVQQWQPIETAPKDGTEIILSREARVTSGLWFDMGGDDEGAEGWSGWVSQDGGFSEEHPPTNWMPLPEPPTEAIREEKETK